MTMLLKGKSGKLYLKEKADIFIGVSSRISRNRHIILLDYDKSKKAESDARYFQAKYDDSPYYILRSSKGHASMMCFRAVTFKEYMKRLLEADVCINFRYYTIKAKQGTLRIMKKPAKKSSTIKLWKIILGNNPEKESQKVKDEVFDMIEKEGGRL